MTVAIRQVGPCFAGEVDGRFPHAANAQEDGEQFGIG